MPFAKGNQLGKANAGKRKDASKKTVWIMESLKEQGYDYERTLVNFLERAAKGDRLAYDMAALLIKLVPHLANAPKSDTAQVQVETLVINRYTDKPKLEAVETTAVDAEEVGRASARPIEPQA